MGWGGLRFDVFKHGLFGRLIEGLMVLNVLYEEGRVDGWMDGWMEAMEWSGLDSQCLSACFDSSEYWQGVWDQGSRHDYLGISPSESGWITNTKPLLSSPLLHIFRPVK